MTDKILRETRRFQEERRAARAVENWTPPGELAVDASDAADAATLAGAEASESQPPPAPPVDADAAFRRARIGFVAAIVLVLFLFWVMERRNVKR